MSTLSRVADLVRSLTFLGLRALDAAIESSELLMSVAPLRFMTVGGMLAVSLFENRPTTKDIDFLLDPNVDAVAEYRTEVRRVINEVGEMHGFNDDWMNDELKIFIRQSNRLNMFLQSVQQGMVVHEGRNLVVYAGRLDFALERKLRRLNGDNIRPRDLDLSDAVALVHTLKDPDHPLSWQYCQSLDDNELGMGVGNLGIKVVADEYERVHGKQGIVETEWDEQVQCHKYVNLQGEWVYVGERQISPRKDDSDGSHGA